MGQIVNIENQKTAQEHLTEPHPIAWKVWLALVGIWIVLWLNMSAPWGVLLLLWIAPTIQSGSIQFVEEVRREQSPLLYWCIEATWIACGVYFIWVDFY